MNRTSTLEELLNDLLAIQQKTDYQYGEYKKPTPILTTRTSQSSQPAETKKN